MLMKYKKEILEVMREFRRRKAFRGTDAEKEEKFRWLLHEFSNVYGLHEPSLVFANIDGSSSGGSTYNLTTNTLTIRGRLSVLTFLHEFAHAKFMQEHPPEQQTGINIATPEGVQQPVNAITQRNNNEQ